MTKLKDFVPPILLDKLRENPLRRYGWFGNYENWEAAEKQSVGYDDNLIIDKVLESTLRVKNGEFPYERDSVLFKEIHYDWPILACLMWVAARNGGKLNVLDFGGSLGSTYWQNKKFLQQLQGLTWAIVEQPRFVELGKKYLEDDFLKFYIDVETSFNSVIPDVLLLSGVISYIKEPYLLLDKLFNFKIKNIILERIPLIRAGKDRLTVQRVPPKIYKASYPAWFFSEDKFFQFVEKHYNIHEIYDCGYKINIPSMIKGMVLTLKN